MGCGLILSLDGSLNQQIQSLWRTLEKAQLGRTPGQFGEPPHVSFSDMKAGDRTKYWDVARRTPFTDLGLRLVPYGVFAGKDQTLYYKAFLSEGLIAAHGAHYQLLQSAGIDFNPLYAPANVIFHCTLAVEVQESRLGEAIAMLGPIPREIQGNVAALEMWEYFPARRLERVRLGIESG